MKLAKYILLGLASFYIATSCSNDDEKDPGNPVLEVKSTFTNAQFGDSLPFSINVSDEVPLSTLKARIYYGEEVVSEVVIRTKTVGEYSNKIYVPFLKDTPDGKATLEFVLQNINFTMVSKTYDLPVSRPVYPSLTFVTADHEYQMTHISGYSYQLTETLPQKIKGYIKSPVITSIGNEMTFGWENNEITHGSTSGITFSNLTAGTYTISFNTLNYEAAPFIIAYTIDGTVMSKIDEDHFKIDMALTNGQEITVEGIDNFGEWWIDPTYFSNVDGNKLTFGALAGDYRIIADFQYQYLKLEALKDGSSAILGAEGTGALWILGDGVGQPTAAANAPGWNPGKGICVPSIGNKKFQITFEAGKTLKLDDIDFKIFHQNGWGGEYSGTTLTTTSDIVFVGDGNGKGNGNLGVLAGKSFEAGAFYIFEIDLSAGNDSAVLTVTKK